MREKSGRRIPKNKLHLKYFIFERNCFLLRHQLLKSEITKFLKLHQYNNILETSFEEHENFFVHIISISVFSIAKQIHKIS